MYVSSVLLVISLLCRLSVPKPPPLPLRPAMHAPEPGDSWGSAREVCEVEEVSVRACVVGQDTNCEAKLHTSDKL